MAFVFDPDDAVSRLRVNVGYYDSGLPFDDGFFESMLSLATDEASATRLIAASLAAYYAQQPSSVSSNGSSVSWTERVKQWNLIAAGSLDTASSSTGAFSYAPVRVDGYSDL